MSLRSENFPEYQTWARMKDRCYNPNHPKYKDYGGRGIRVCDRWFPAGVGFKNFLADMGKRPDGHSLDRIDVNGPYSPENCRWATASVQTHNQRPKKHSTKITGVYEHPVKGVKYYTAVISKDSVKYSKTTRSFDDAVLWRAKKEEELYGTRNMQTDKIIALIKDWGRQHKINNPDKQLLHCYEEVAEIGRLVIRGDYNKEELTKELGDVFVTTIILADIFGYDAFDCMEKAFLKIQKRTGKTVDGNFIKSEDLDGQAGAE